MNSFINTILLLLSTTHSYLIPEHKSNNNQGFCPEGFQTRGWFLASFESKVTVLPVDKIGLIASDDQIIIRFCESSSVNVFPGNYCVFKGSKNCPSRFKNVAFEVDVPNKLDVSSKVGDLSLCCSENKRFTSTAIQVPIKPPYTLIKNGAVCQKIDKTSVRELAAVVDNTTVLNLCYYDVYGISCVHCQHTCERTDYGALCSCFQGYTLSNNSHCRGTNQCEVHNGQCDQICDYNNNTDITCRCYQGYYLYKDKICLPDNVTIGNATYLGQDTLHNNTVNQLDKPLFSINRDFIVMLITLAVILVILLIILCVCVKLNYILCSCPTIKPSCSKISWSKVTLRHPRARHKRLSANLNRNSISAPHVGDVAVDLLNRPKTHSSVRMHDLPSRTSFYANTTPVHSSEGGYDSLDRRRVLEKQKSERHYDEPECESKQPLVLPSNRANNYNYCGPDGDVPETPLPAYSNSSAEPAYSNSSTSTPYDTDPDPDYNVSQNYEDPAAKFSVGKLGGRPPSGVGARPPSGVGARPRTDSKPGAVGNGTTVARIAPTPRSHDSQFSFNNRLKK